MMNMLLLSLSAVLFFSIDVKAEATDTSEVSLIASGDNCGKDCHWSIDSNGHMTITGSGTMTSNPWLQDKTVRDSIVSLDVQGVTNIMRNAFVSSYGRANNVKSVTIGDSVQTISAYGLPNNLQELVIPQSVTHIEGAHATKVYCPQGLDCHSTSGETIFYEKISDGLYKVGNQIYSNFNEIPPTKNKFYECGSSLEACSAVYNAETGTLTITGNGTMTSNPWLQDKTVRDSIVSLDVQGVTNIMRNAFVSSYGRANNVKSVTIGDSVQTISAYGLPNNLQELVIPQSVTSIASVQAKKVYCPEGLDCRNTGGETFFYTQVGAYYQMNGKMYRDVEYMIKGVEMKRIYTVSEATEALGKNNRNTFSIRYR